MTPQKRFRKYGEAAEGRAAEAVDRLIVVADGDDVAAFAGEQPEQFELGDVGILKFVHQDVAVLVLHFPAERVVGLRGGARCASTARQR